jgi:hypothetical protein
MTDDPALPAWADVLMMRRTLWQDYGIASTGLSLTDVFRATRLSRAEAARSQALQARGSDGG